MTFLFSSTYSYIRRLLREIKQPGKGRRLKRLFSTSAIIIFILMLFLAITFSGIGVISEIEAHGDGDVIQETVTGIPEDVVQDAEIQAELLFGNSWKTDLFKDQLIGAYREAQDKDFVIMFNSGGWGTKTIDASVHWTTIMDGIESELIDSGYSVITLSYQRTYDSLQGKLHETKEMLTGYLGKSKDLAVSVDFLTRHNPDLKVIITGESMGTIICDSTMNKLKKNDHVFSIQTGSPFWQRNTVVSRTVQINNNGNTPDAFHNGDLWAIIKSSAKSLVGIEDENDRGEILGFLAAPGHEYWWDDPGVYGQINTFLTDQFGIQSNQ